MDDHELQQIREARMRELKSRQSQAQTSDSNASQKNDDMLASVLAQLLDQPARERLNRVRIVKPERATQVEQILMRMAQSGQLGQRVDDSALKLLLDKLAQQDSAGQRLVFSRRSADSSDDENLIGATQPSTLASAGNDSDSDSDFFN